MPNYILSYDLDNASSVVRLDFTNELMKQGWTIWERRTIDNDIHELPNTTMVIKDKTDSSAIASINAAVQNTDLVKKGATLDKWVISEYRRVYFESDKELSAKGGKAAELLRKSVEDVLIR